MKRTDGGIIGYRFCHRQWHLHLKCFLVFTLQDNQIWPIYEYAEYYDEKELFTVIEILYDHIAKYDYRESKLDKEGAQAEFAEHINNILRAYKDGYYLVPTTGFIMKQSNQALKEQT